MKVIYLFIAISLFICSCSKKKNKITYSTTPYTVEGQLYKTSTNKPIVGYGIVIRQDDDDNDPRYDYLPTDPRSYSDSTGKFIITYYPSSYNGKINLYKLPIDYTCHVYNTLLSGIEKNKNLNLGKLYIE